MTNEEIRKEIDKNNERIFELTSKIRFTLNKEVNDLLAENRKLQSQCHHVFDEEGICIFCDAMEEFAE